MSKTIYHYHATSGEFLEQGDARESPMQPGEYIIPAHSTDVAPPAVSAGFARVWVNGAWMQREDHRGIWFAGDGSRITVRNLGPVPAIAVTQTPPPAFGVWNGSSWDVDTAAQAAAAAAEAELARLETEKAQVKGDAPIKALVNMTPEEIETWFATNVTDLSSARDAMIKMTKVLAVLARREFL